MSDPAAAATPLRSPPLLQVEDLRTQFESAQGTARVLDGVTFTLSRADTLGLVGESGSGKTMTALSILGLVPPPGRVVSGTVRFEGQELLALAPDALRKVRGRDIALVFQEPLGTFDPVMPVGAQVAEMLREHRRLPRRVASREAVEMLRRVHLPDPARVARQYAHQLSGGMGQRVAVAMALAGGPKLLIADEAASGLDLTIQAQMRELLAEVQHEQGMAMLWISHDLAAVAQVASRVAVMYAGRIVEIGPTRRVFDAPHHPYTRALLRARPRLERRRQGLEAMAGAAPLPTRLPAYCPFYDRCPARENRCKLEDPPERFVGPLHLVRCLVDPPSG